MRVAAVAVTRGRQGNLITSYYTRTFWNSKWWWGRAAPYCQKIVPRACITHTDTTGTSAAALGCRWVYKTKVNYISKTLPARAYSLHIQYDIYLMGVVGAFLNPYCWHDRYAGTGGRGRAKARGRSRSGSSKVSMNWRKFPDYHTSKLRLSGSIWSLNYPTREVRTLRALRRAFVALLFGR